MSLERDVQQLTVEVRALVATLQERCPQHQREIDNLWKVTRATSAKVWGLAGLLLVALLGLIAKTFAVK